MRGRCRTATNAKLESLQEDGKIPAIVVLCVIRHLARLRLRKENDGGQHRRRHRRRYLFQVSPPFICDMAARIDIPTLLLRGERSPDLFGRILQELERCMPKRDLVVVSATSHTVPAENPAGFRAVVVPFLEKH